MPILMNSHALTFDDILLVPKYSEVASRANVDISTNLLGRKYAVPICSANMDTVTEYTMAVAMERQGGLGILHRYADPTLIKEWVTTLKNQGFTAIPSIGVKLEDVDLALEYTALGADAINIDIAHGDSKHMIEMIKKLKLHNIKVIAGNIATYHAACRLADVGADVIKVGIGGGSLCTTRIVTGHGIPQLQAIKDCVRVKDHKTPHVQIIADGGIRNSGDIVKALAFGADMVMVGSLLSGTNETPGDMVQVASENGHFLGKQYRGMASRAARSNVAKIDSTYTAEGEATYVKAKGPVADVINQLAGGIRSGLSYSGVTNLSSLRQDSQYVLMTGHGMAESQPHLIR